MTQLTLEFENNIIKNRLLKVIELIDGVTVVKPQTKSKTKKSGLDEAMEDVQKGDTIKCNNFEEYLELVK